MQTRTLFIDGEGQTSLVTQTAVPTMDGDWVAVATFPILNSEHARSVLHALIQPLPPEQLLAWRRGVMQTR